MPLLACPAVPDRETLLDKPAVAPKKWFLPPVYLHESDRTFENAYNSPSFLRTPESSPAQAGFAGVRTLFTRFFIDSKVVNSSHISVRNQQKKLLTGFSNEVDYFALPEAP